MKPRHYAALRSRFDRWLNPHQSYPRSHPLGQSGAAADSCVNPNHCDLLEGQSGAAADSCVNPNHCDLLEGPEPGSLGAWKMRRAPAVRRCRRSGGKGCGGRGRGMRGAACADRDGAAARRAGAGGQKGLLCQFELIELSTLIDIINRH